MAATWRLGGLPLWLFVRRVWQLAWRSDITGQAAQLSFYFLLAIFPFLLFLTALLGVFLHSNAALEVALRTYLSAVIPASASALIDRTLDQISRGPYGGQLSFSALFTLWAASKGMSAIIGALNAAYEVRESRRWWKRKLISLVLTGVLSLLGLLALALVFYGGHLGQLINRQFNLGDWFPPLWRALQWVPLLAFVLLAFNILYIYGPNVEHRRWHWLMPGTVVGVGLWMGCSYGFKLYLSFFNRYRFTYGSIGTVIILLVWLYLTGIAILVGGAVNSELEEACHTVKGKARV